MYSEYIRILQRPPPERTQRRASAGNDSNSLTISPDSSFTVFAFGKYYYYY